MPTLRTKEATLLVATVTAAAPASAAGSGVVLIVDDEEDILDSLSQLLEASRPGLRSLTATSGEAALEILRDTEVDCVVTDYRMPGMDGIELLRRLHRVAPGTPAIMITAYADPFQNGEVNGLPAVPVLPKPVEIDRFLEVVGNVLQAPQA